VFDRRCPGFDPGRRFTASTTRRASGTTYLLTEVRHHATAPYAETGGEQPRYSNDYVAIPADLPFRPQRLTAWPVVHGPQTATVMGPSGESIHTDDMEGKSTVPLGPARQAGRHRVLLDPRVAALGGIVLGRAVDPACRAGGGDQLPGG